MYCDMDNLLLSKGSKMYGLTSDSVAIQESSDWRRVCGHTSLVRLPFISSLESLKPWVQHPVNSLQNTELFGFWGVYMRAIWDFYSTVYLIITVRDEKVYMGFLSIVKVLIRV